MRAGSSPPEEELDSADSEAAWRRREGGGGPGPDTGRRTAAATGEGRRRRSDLSTRSDRSAVTGAGLATLRVMTAPPEPEGLLLPEGLPPLAEGLLAAGRTGGRGRERAAGGSRCRSVWEGRAAGRERGGPGDGRRPPLAAGREEGEAERDVTLVELLDQLLLELRWRRRPREPDRDLQGHHVSRVRLHSRISETTCILGDPFLYFCLKVSLPACFLMQFDTLISSIVSISLNSGKICRSRPFES